MRASGRQVKDDYGGMSERFLFAGVEKQGQEGSGRGRLPANHDTVVARHDRLCAARCPLLFSLKKTDRDARA